MRYRRPSLVARARSWHNQRQYVHAHGEPGDPMWRHAHMHPKQYHEHEADLPCVRPECDQFTRHRIHPFPVL